MSEGLPEEIIVEETPLLTDEEGKQYAHEKDGVKYGGDFLPEPPETIILDEDFPAPPKEINNVL